MDVSFLIYVFAAALAVGGSLAFIAAKLNK